MRELEAREKHLPVVPSTLKAELRDYQQEGFCWLSRLAHWGVGACLADDMGLGKNLQTLALLLERAPHGPQLVVAPTSVTYKSGGVAKNRLPASIKRHSPLKIIWVSCGVCSAS